MNGIEFGEGTILAPGVKIISANHDLGDLSRFEEGGPVKIGKSCWIGANAVVLPGVELGDHTVVGAGAVVAKSFPSHRILAGNPVAEIGRRCTMCLARIEDGNPGRTVCGRCSAAGSG
jgi:acetyltransferase-like isoleucine patch superfamily enzyme